jgi:hypothetical protein
MGVAALQKRADAGNLLGCDNKSSLSSDELAEALDDRCLRIVRVNRYIVLLP